MSADKRSGKRRRLTWSDWPKIRRVLAYAVPYRAQIGLALVLGLFSSFLMALNLAALIPVLQILLEREAYEQNLSALDDEIQALEQEYAAAGNWLSQWDPWFDLQIAYVERDWVGWVVENRVQVIITMAVVLLLAQLLRITVEYFSKYTLQKCFFLAVVRLKNDLYAKCLELDLGNFDNLKSSDLVARLNNDVRAVRLVFTNLLGEAVLAPFSVLFLLLFLLWIDLWLTIIVIVGLPAVILPISFLGKWLRQLGRQDEEEEARLLGISHEAIQGRLIVKTYASERREQKRFRDLARDIARRQIRREGFRLLGAPAVEVVASLAMALVLLAGAWLVLAQDAIGPSMFLAYLFALTRFYPPIKKVSNTFVKSQKALASADRIFEVIDTEPAIAEKPGAIDLPPFSKSIAFENVSFCYREDVKVLENFHFEIPKGRKVALVGRSGSGKTTIARLIPRLFDVTDGRITIDGHDIRDVTLRSLRRQIAMVSQEVIIFSGTIRENIAYADPDASEEQVIAAAKAANADEFIRELPLGYETETGEGGARLSGGQKQRITIARALLANTPIMILDEATSALDNESEALVQQAIDRLMENRTVIMIAHRLSTIRKADEIVVLEEGAGITERGSHEELMQVGGAYARMLQQADLTE